jgi:hypothetical protein
MPNEVVTDPNQNPGAQAGGGEPKQDKLFAGKYKTAEELEEGYKQLQGLTTRVSQRVADLEYQMEQDAAQRNVVTNTDQGAQDPNGFANIFSSKLFTDPEGTLASREQKLRDDIRREVQTTVSAAALYQRFLGRNPDLEPYEDMLVQFINREHPQSPANERLENAGKALRAEIQKIRATGNRQTGRAANANEFVESPDQLGAGDRQAIVPKEQEPSEEDRLSEYLKERAQVVIKKRI